MNGWFQSVAVDFRAFCASRMGEGKFGMRTPVFGTATASAYKVARKFTIDRIQRCHTSLRIGQAV